MADQVVWLVGAGVHAAEYAKVLKNLNVKFEVIGRGAESAAKFETNTGHPVHLGGLDNFLSANLLPVDNQSVVAIVTVTIPNLATCTLQLIKHGVNTILLEKPGGRDSGELVEIVRAVEEAEKTGRRMRVRLAYNRRFYASVRKAQELANEDGGITSFIFEFTEWSHIIANLPHPESVKHSWFLGNSHVLDLAFFLGGQPTKLKCFNAGKGEVAWHPQSSVWVGSGITEKNALFSYHANWAAPGRWWLEVLTRKNRYIFRPLEKLHVTRLGSVKVEQIDIDDSLDQSFKPGLWLQTKTFLENPDHPDLLPVDKQLGRVQKFYEPMRGMELPKLASILIIGVGNVGSRHLQALAALDMAVNIVVVESFKQSLDRAKSIYDNEPKANASSRVTYLQLIDDITIGSAFDVCIIATASPPRRKVIESLLERCKIKHLIIEKVLFQTAKDHEDVQAMFIQSGVNAYVHLQWCAIPMYKYMKDHIKGPVNLHIHGQGWGLCCNSIHLVALASYLNDSQDVRIDGSGLKPGYQESKRKGFVEVFGTLKGEVKSKHGKADFTLVCTDGPLTEGRTLHIWNDTVKMYWTEQTGSLFSSFAASDWKWERREFPFPFVSQWTNKLVKQLLETGTSDLPLYADVYQMSILLNNLYISHLADAGNADAQEGVCPIT